MELLKRTLYVQEKNGLTIRYLLLGFSEQTLLEKPQ